MKYLIPDTPYKVLTYLATIGLDAVGTLYNALSSIWGLPYGSEVLQTAVAVSVCIGVLCGISTATGKQINE